MNWVALITDYRGLNRRPLASQLLLTSQDDEHWIQSTVPYLPTQETLATYVLAKWPSQSIFRKVQVRRLVV